MLQSNQGGGRTGGGLAEPIVLSGKRDYDTVTRTDMLPGWTGPRKADGCFS
jgi:hypothetical protein